MFIYAHQLKRKSYPFVNFSNLLHNTIVESVFSFDESTSLSKNALKQRVDNVIYNGKGTHTYLGLEWMIDNNITGIFHVAGKEPISKYDFGMRVCKMDAEP